MTGSYSKIELIKGTSWSLGSRVFQALAKSVAIIFIARILGPESFGGFMLIISISTILTPFFDLGISPACARLLAEDIFDKRKVIKKTFLLITVSIVVLSILFLNLFDLVQGILSYEGMSELKFLILTLTIFLILQKLFSKIFEGIRRVSDFGQINLIAGWFPWLLSLLFILFVESSVKFALIGYISGYFIFITLLLVKLIFSNFKFKNSEKEEVSYIKIIRYALPMIATTASLYVYTQSDILLIQYFLGSEMVGIYSAAVKVIEAGMVAAMAIGNGTSSYFPLARSQGKEIYKNILLQSSKAINLIYIPAIAAIIIAFNEIVHILYGIEYSGAGLILLIYCPYLLSRALSCVYSLALDYLGYADKRAMAVSVSAISNILLNIFLIPLWGIIGAAISTQITYVPLVLLYLYLLLKDASISFTAYNSFISKIWFVWLILLFPIVAITYFLAINNIVFVVIYIIIFFLILIRMKIVNISEIISV